MFLQAIYKLKLRHFFSPVIIWPLKCQKTDSHIANQGEILIVYFVWLAV